MNKLRLAGGIILWLFYFVANLLCMALCYLTNWVVVLFADENGELHGIWRYWQTWDASLDQRWYVRSGTWKPIRYDYDLYYDYKESVPIAHGRVYDQAIRKNVPMPLSVRIKRYCCRACWIYRNCGYGFAYEWFGQNIQDDVVEIKMSDRTRFLQEKNGLAWTLSSDAPICKYIRWEVYLGWKIQYPYKAHRAMIANRATVRILIGGQK